MQGIYKMIFVTPKYMPVVFNQAMFDAINVYAYFKSHSLKELLEGLSCNVNEFEINEVMLRLAVYLNYTDLDNISYDSLTDFLGSLEGSLEQESLELGEIAESDLKGFYLIYLVLSERGEAFEVEFAKDDRQVIFDKIKTFLCNLVEETKVIIL